VRKVEMVLENDEFLITYDPAKGNDELLVETVKQSGYAAQVVSNEVGRNQNTEETVLPQGYPILDKALTQAQRENKPLVLDFHAEWCIPCKQMEKEVFPDPKVAAQLKQVVFVRIDTDLEPELTQKLGVVGLPDIRFATSSGKIVHKTIGFQDTESFAKQLDELLKSADWKNS
jgi:thiol:disulfide interchange protein